MRPLPFLALLILALLHASPGAAERYAERIEPHNAPQRQVGGPDAIGGIGDWALGNGTLCAVISGLEHESMLSPRGGVLVDLAHCGRADDQWNSLLPVLNLSRSGVPSLDEITARTDADAVRIETRGRFEGFAVETEYALVDIEPDVLRITTRVQREQPGTRLRLLGDLALHGNGSLAPFTLSLRRPELSVGFRHPPAHPEKPLELVRALVPADVHVWPGAGSAEVGVAYALQLRAARLERPSAPPRDLPILAINGIDFSMFGVLTRPLWLGRWENGLSLAELAQLAFMDLRDGETLVVERAMRMGDRSDVASVADALYPDAPLVSGRIDDPEARLHIMRADGAPASEVAPDAEGRFEFRIPPGRYRLEVRAAAGRGQTSEFEVDDRDRVLPPIELGAAPGLRLAPVDAPLRLVFLREDGAALPLLGDDLRGFTVGEEAAPMSGASRDLSLSGGPGDPGEISLPPGRYRVLATRGPEFGLIRASFHVPVQGALPVLALAPPPRLLETPGWASADLHMHAAPSDDSTLPLAARVVSLAAQGVDVVVSSEHDQVTDYGPVIRSLGLAPRLASVVGVEITSSAMAPAVPFTSGHLNGFPFDPEPLSPRGGAPRSEGIRVREIAANLRARGGQRLLQLNHPRGSGEVTTDSTNQLFDHLAVAGAPFDPTRPLSDPANETLVARDPTSGLRDLDFDAVELMNGPSLVRYRRTRADWLSLLLQGERRTATANSDSHGLGTTAALPRSYVAMADDDPARFDQAAFVEAISSGRVYGTTGPLLDVRLGGAGLGDLHTGRTGLLRVAVDAAPWVPVDRLRVYVDGAVASEAPVAAGALLEIPLSFEGDAFVTVEVEGDIDRPEAADFRAVAPGFQSFAFTNPIFVDADGDGRWQPRGLVAPLPPTLTHPERSSP